MVECEHEWVWHGPTPEERQKPRPWRDGVMIIGLSFKYCGKCLVKFEYTQKEKDANLCVCGQPYYGWTHWCPYNWDETKRKISWSIVKRLIREFHVCPFCFKPLRGEEIIIELGKAVHPLAENGRLSFPVFAVHNSCFEHGSLTGDALCRDPKTGEWCEFGNLIMGCTTKKIGWEIDYET